MKKLGLLLLCLVQTGYGVTKTRYNKYSSKNVQVEVAKIKQRVQDLQAQTKKYILSNEENKQALAQIKKLEKERDALKTARMRTIEKELNGIAKQKCLLTRSDPQAVAVARKVNKLEKKILILTKQEHAQIHALQKELLVLCEQLPVYEHKWSLAQRDQVKLLESKINYLNNCLENKINLSKPELLELRKQLQEKNYVRAQAYDMVELDKKYTTLEAELKNLHKDLAIDVIHQKINQLHQGIQARAQPCLNKAQTLINELAAQIPKSKSCNDLVTRAASEKTFYS